MNITAQKWGNSLAVRLPKHIVQKAHLSPGVQLSICIDSQGNIEMIPLSRKEKLHQYLEKITDKNRHSEVVSKEFATEKW